MAQYQPEQEQAASGFAEQIHGFLFHHKACWAENG